MRYHVRVTDGCSLLPDGGRCRAGARLLLGLPKTERRAAGAAVRAIQQYGLAAPGVSTRQIRGKLWEIRTGDDRVFHCVAAGPIVWLLHAYRKAGTDEINRVTRGEWVTLVLGKPSAD